MGKAPPRETMSFWQELPHITSPVAFLLCIVNPIYSMVLMGCLVSNTKGRRTRLPTRDELFWPTLHLIVSTLLIVYHSYQLDRRLVAQGHRKARSLDRRIQVCVTIVLGVAGWRALLIALPEMCTMSLPVVLTYVVFVMAGYWFLIALLMFSPGFYYTVYRSSARDVEA